MLGVICAVTFLACGKTGVGVSEKWFRLVAGLHVPASGNPDAGCIRRSSDEQSQFQHYSLKYSLAPFHTGAYGHAFRYRMDPFIKNALAPVRFHLITDADDMHRISDICWRYGFITRDKFFRFFRAMRRLAH